MEAGRYGQRLPVLGAFPDFWYERVPRPARSRFDCDRHGDSCADLFDSAISGRLFVPHPLVAFARILHDHAARSASASAGILGARYRGRSLESEFFAPFFASSILVARKRYSDYVVRALIGMAARHAEEADRALCRRRYGDSLLGRVTDLEKEFLKGMTEQAGLAQVAVSCALPLAFGHFPVEPKEDERALDCLMDALFGHVACEARQYEMADDISTFLAERLAGHMDAAEYLVERHLFTDLARRFVPACDRLPSPARARLLCSFPALESDSPLASAYKVHFRVMGRLTAGNLVILDRGVETHLAPDGPGQAINRTLVHLRHRWYPRATAVNVVKIETVPPADCGNVSRHFSVLLRSTNAEVVGLGICGVDAADALQSPYARTKGYTADNVVLRERPLLLGGRKPRPKLILDRFIQSPTADARGTSTGE